MKLETSEATHIEVRGCDGRVFATLLILRTVTLKGIAGFCIHRYITDDGTDEYRVSHTETGAYLTRASTDGEAFVLARRFSKEEIEHAALASEAFQKQAQGAAPKKVIVVPGRLVNIVV